MPTENRSRNTENAPCPFCGGRVDPEGWLRGDGARGPECESCGATAPNLALWNAAQPAQQHQGEPVALPERRRDDLDSCNPVTQRRAEGWNKCLDEIAKLGPLYTHPAPADSAEVERLREGISKHWKVVCDQRAELETLRAQLAQAQALLGTIAGWTEETRAAVLEAFQDELNESASYEWYDSAIADLMKLIQAVPASAGPSAPAAAYPNRLCHIDYTAHPYLCGCLKGDKEAQRRYDEQFVKPSAEPSALVMQIPEGYCVMPKQLTAENGAKALLLGEFKLEVTHDCPECAELEEPAESCEICDGEGQYGQRHVIPWDKIKFIYSEAVKGLALKQ